MSGLLKFGISLCLMLAVNGVPSSNMKEEIRDEPPLPKHNDIFDGKESREDIATRLDKWNPEDENNIWELSGLYEGDIMRPAETSDKNGLLDEEMRWPDAIVPYYIKKDDFTAEQIKLIEDAFEAYHNNTCVRFRAYKKGDQDYVKIQGSRSGCWSYVGKHGEGQVVNLQNPGCLRSGTIIHELMHALGFYHQQSAADRDDWVRIMWSNITPGREHNFNKYGNRTVSDYGVGYDYGSVMHYSAKAFSRNGQKTIVPKMENVTLGQRKGFSEKDIKKINLMYKVQCEARENKEKEKPSGGSSTIDIISSLWPLNTFKWSINN